MVRSTCLAALLLAIGVRESAAQSGTLSRTASVTLVARKLSTVGLTPASAEPMMAGAAAVDDGVPRVVTHWNLAPTLVGSVLLRAAQGARTGPAYIERRLLVTDPIATTTHALILGPARDPDPDALLLVRLVVY